MFQASPQLKEIVSQPRFGGLDLRSASYLDAFQLSNIQHYQAVSGSLLWFFIQKDDLIRISSKSEEQPIFVAALSDQNQSALAELNLSQNNHQTISCDQYFTADIQDYLRARNLTLSDLQFAEVELCAQDDIQHVSIILRAKENLCLFLVFPINQEQSLITGENIADFAVEIQKANNTLPPLPQYLGEVQDEFLVDRATAKAYKVKQGEYIQVIDFEGQQCSDFLAFNAHALEQGKERFIDSTVTRSLVGAAYPIPGLFSKFFDQDMQPLVEVVQDTVGRHDTFALACTARGYEERGFPGHVNCSDNISAVFSPYGIRPKKGWPAINFFFNTWINSSDNQIQSDTCWSRAGDYVLMKALTDLVCVNTACPDDIDPINGWNPTDILVRIYSDKSKPKRSVGYRLATQAGVTMSKESPFHSRTSKLTNQFTSTTPYWTPTHYDASGAIAEYWACKNRATIQDMSNLRIFDVYGEDAEEFMDFALTRDVRKLALDKAFYALLCDEFGSIIDDGTLFRLAPNLFRWCCGSDESAYHLKKIAQEKNYHAWIRDMSDQLCNLAIQGPKSYHVLKDLVFIPPTKTPFDNLRWFSSSVARLDNNFGIPFLLSRTGFTGELGYEIFCAKKDALEIWDAIIKAGEKYDLIPMGSDALNSLRIEAGLMVAGYEFGSQVMPHEANLSFAIDFKKNHFIGKDAIEQQTQNQRQNLYGLILAGNELPLHGDRVFLDRKQVGVITSASRSHQLKKNIALVRLEKTLCKDGVALEIGKLDGYQKRLKCKTTTIPFIDPKREKPRTMNF